MIRQDIKSKEYFEKYLLTGKSFIDRGFEMLANGKVAAAQVNRFKKGQFDLLYNYAIASYTAGENKEGVKKHVLAAIAYLKESWAPEIVLLNNGKQYNQYNADTYVQMLSLLSLAYLLDIGNSDFAKLVEIIDRDHIKDYLYEFIIKAKQPERKVISSESYQEFFGIPNAYEGLRTAIAESDKDKAEKSVKAFMKNWAKKQKELGIALESHKSKHDTYFGYWSFETAAVAAILGLNEDDLNTLPYYPKEITKSE